MDASFYTANGQKAELVLIPSCVYLSDMHGELVVGLKVAVTQWADVQRTFIFGLLLKKTTPKNKAQIRKQNHVNTCTPLISHNRTHTRRRR